MVCIGPSVLSLLSCSDKRFRLGRASLPAKSVSASLASPDLLIDWEKSVVGRGYGDVLDKSLLECAGGVSFIVSWGFTCRI